MKVDIRQLPDGVKEFDYYLSRENCSRIDDVIQFQEPGLHCKGKVRSHGVEVFLEGYFQVKVETVCDLCLDPVIQEVEGEVSVISVPQGYGEQTADDYEISPEEGDVDYYTESVIDLDHIFEDQFLLEFPLNITCKDDCKGLCSQCGTNLNKTECDCSKTIADNPFLILKDMKL